MLNFKSNVYRDEWLNLVFAGRNQLYGAYQLRQEYSGTLLKALGVSIALFVTVLAVPFVYHRFFKTEVSVTERTLDVVLDTSLFIMQPKKIEKQQASVPASPKTETPKVETRQFVVPTIVHDDPSAVDMPVISELAHVDIGSEDGKGEPSNGAGSLGGAGNGATGNEEGGTSTETGNSVFIHADKAPEFPGGPEAFAKFIRKNLRYPGRASEANVTGRVVISFVVERDGSMSDVKVLKGIGFGCDEEALRVLKKVPSWIPGEQNGRKVRVQYTVPLVFLLEN